MTEIKKKKLPTSLPAVFKDLGEKKNKDYAVKSHKKCFRKKMAYRQGCSAYNED